MRDMGWRRKRFGEEEKDNGRCDEMGGWDHGE